MGDHKKCLSFYSTTRQGRPYFIRCEIPLRRHDGDHEGQGIRWPPDKPKEPVQ